MEISEIADNRFEDQEFLISSTGLKQSKPISIDTKQKIFRDNCVATKSIILSKALENETSPTISFKEQKYNQLKKYPQTELITVWKNILKENECVKDCLNVEDYCIKSYASNVEHMNGRSSIKRKSPNFDHSGSDLKSGSSEDDFDHVSMVLGYAGRTSESSGAHRGPEQKNRNINEFNITKIIQERSPKSSDPSVLECHEYLEPIIQNHNSQSTKFEKHWFNFQNSMKILASKGYRVESLINNVWVQPSVWKLTKLKPLEIIEQNISEKDISLEKNLNTKLEKSQISTPSLNDLLVAAELSSN